MPYYVVTVEFSYTERTEDRVKVEAASAHEAETKALKEFSEDENPEVLEVEKVKE